MAGSLPLKYFSCRTPAALSLVKLTYLPRLARDVASISVRKAISKFSKFVSRLRWKDIFASSRVLCFAIFGTSSVSRAVWTASMNLPGCAVARTTRAFSPSWLFKPIDCAACRATAVCGHAKYLCTSKLYFMLSKVS